MLDLDCSMAFQRQFQKIFFNIIMSITIQASIVGHCTVRCRFTWATLAVLIPSYTGVLIIESVYRQIFFVFFSKKKKKNIRKKKNWFCMFFLWYIFIFCLIFLIIKKNKVGLKLAKNSSKISWNLLMFKNAVNYIRSSVV